MRGIIRFCSLLLCTGILCTGILYAFEDVETKRDTPEQGPDTLSLSDIPESLESIQDIIQEPPQEKPAEVRFMERSFWGNVVGFDANDSFASRSLIDTSVLSLSGHSSSIESLQFCPYEKQLLSGGADGVAILWDSVSGRIIRRLASHRAPVTAVAFGPGGNRYITAGRDRRLLLWDNTAVNPIKEFVRLPSEPTAIALNGTGHLLVGFMNGDVAFYKLSDAQPYKVIRAHAGSVNSLAFNPKGNTFVTTGNNETVALWDMATGEGLGILRGHRSAVLCAAFSPDGTQIVSGGTDKTVFLWDAINRTEKQRLTGHTGDITGVFFSKDGSKVLTCSWDRSVFVWDVQTGAKLLQSEKRNSPIGTADTEAATGNIALGALNGMIEILTPTALRPEKQETAATTGLEKASTGFETEADETEQMMTSVSANTTVFPPTIPRGRQVFRIGRTNTYGEQGSISKDGKLLLTLSVQTAETILWNTGNGREIQRLLGGSQVTAVAIHPTEPIAFSGSRSGKIQFWELTNYRITDDLQDHESPLSVLAVSPDGSLLCTGAVNGAVSLWDTKTKTRIQSTVFDLGSITALAISPNNVHIAVSTNDGSITLWTPNDDSVRSLRRQSEGRVCLAFFPIGEHLVSGSQDGKLVIWNLQTGQPVNELWTNQQGVLSVAVSPNAQLIATGGEDTQTVLWDTKTLTPKMILPFQGGPVTSVLFNPAEFEVITIGGRTPILWNIRDIAR